MVSTGTLLELVDHNAAEHPGLAATVDGPSTLSWAAYRNRARAVALALLDLGVEPHDTVGLHMVNRAEHVQADLGALYAAATPVSYYATLAADQLSYVVADSAAVVAVVDDAQLPLWLAVRDRVPTLRHILVLDHPADDLPEGVQRWEDVLAKAEAGLPSREAEVDAAAAKVRPEDALTIVYTSGTTGHPKGTLITHAGVLFVMDGVAEMGERTGAALPGPGSATMSYLPLAHIAERMFSHYVAIRQASTVTYVRDYTTLSKVLPSVRPLVFLGVPRIWEKMYGTIRERVGTESNPVRKELGSRAVAVARARGRALCAGRRPDPLTALAYPVLDRLVLGRIRAALGLDRVVMAASGAAPLAAEVVEFFRGMDITITEAYGMTETSAVLTVTPANRPRPGTVGVALPGIELRIAPDGEVLARGPNITPGYLNRPEATAETIDADGWLHTGDLGDLDGDGYLTITGRKKELIINAAGKNISPANVQLAISAASDLVGPVYVYGDNKPYLVALVTLDSMSWQEWCQARGVHAATVAEAVTDEKVRAEVDRAVQAGNDQLARVEQVKRWTLLDHVWDSTSGELTPTMKLKRPVITERYQAEIDTLYS
jgi:long-chain acyl-CoA synthetase